MENATDALYMGFAILVFVIALSLSIFSFSEVTSASQRIIDARDKTTFYSYVVPQGTSRIVTREDIIPTLYRIAQENYIVSFDFKNLLPENNNNLFEVNKTEENDTIKTSIIKSDYIRNAIIDVSNPNDKNKVFINALLEGKLDNLIKKKNMNNNIKDYLPNEGLYDILGGNTFKEDIGVYSTVKGNGETVDNRVITYTYIN